ncbi:MAG: hypothetical protein ACT4NY_28295, partial [Pseudonocardiales bacterium]
MTPSPWPRESARQPLGASKLYLTPNSPYPVLGTLIVGSTEKLAETGDNSYGVQVLRLELEEALATTSVTHVVDLCDSRSRRHRWPGWNPGQR